jgi:hypothetical protein
MLLGVVNHLMDDDVAYGAVAQLARAMPAGSYLVLAHSTAEIHGEPVLRVMRETTERGGTPIRARTKRNSSASSTGSTCWSPAS